MFVRIQTKKIRTRLFGSNARIDLFPLNSFFEYGQYSLLIPMHIQKSNPA